MQKDAQVWQRVMTMQDETEPVDRGWKTKASILPVLRWLAWVLLGALLIMLMYQVPARHLVLVGHNDASYVQNFNDPTNRWGVEDGRSGMATPLRWSRDRSYLIFPQVGLPATATIRWRALRDPGEALPTVTVLLNGGENLGTFKATGDWETHTFRISGGILKLNDLYVELRTDPTVRAGDQVRGVQVEMAELATNSWPVLPYPSQIALGGLAVGLAMMSVRGARRRLVACFAIALAFLLLYRLQIFYYPLLTLPILLPLALGAVVVVRSLPRWRWAALPQVAVALAAGGIALWLVWLLQTAQAHVVLSVPGVERDFSVFSARASMLGCAGVPRADAPCVLRADGFYQLGYPSLLGLFKPLTSGNAFLSARIVGGVSSVLMLGATWALGWRLLGRGPALLALSVLALSAFVVEYGLYTGTDMPFAALWTVGLASLLVPDMGRYTRWTTLVAGFVCGLAFLMRHPGLILLPVGWIMLIVQYRRAPPSPTPGVAAGGWRGISRRVPWRLCLLFTLGWLVAALPQLAVNVADTGQPLYNQQAKNIWLAVYGNTDWSHWEEASNGIALRDVVLADPARFVGNWWRNLQAFSGTGAEDTREFGEAIDLRLLAFPANWLALAGLGIWLLRGGRRERLLLGVTAVYVVAVCFGFVLPRFFLPLVPVWALACATAVMELARLLARGVGFLRWPRLQIAQWAMLLSLGLLALSSTGPQIGARYVLDHQDSDSAALVQTLLPHLHSGDKVLFALPSTDLLPRYSAISHDSAGSAPEAAQFGVWSPDAGKMPAALRSMQPWATFGKYRLFARDKTVP